MMDPGVNGSVDDSATWVCGSNKLRVYIIPIIVFDLLVLG